MDESLDGDSTAFGTCSLLCRLLGETPQILREKKTHSLRRVIQSASTLNSLSQLQDSERQRADVLL